MEIENQRFGKDWDFLTNKALLLFAVTYNGIIALLLYLFWGHALVLNIAVCVAGYLTLVFSLLLRYSSTFRRFTVRPERDTKQLQDSLVLPIILWFTIPTAFLFFPIPL